MKAGTGRASGPTLALLGAGGSCLQRDGDLRRSIEWGSRVRDEPSGQRQEERNQTPALPMKTLRMGGGVGWGG